MTPLPDALNVDICALVVDRVETDNKDETVRVENAAEFPPNDVAERVVNCPLVEERVETERVELIIPLLENTFEEETVDA